MTMMRIHATFVWPGYAEAPELACAWDEFYVDENGEAWEKERADRIASYGTELLRPDMVRDVRIAVPVDSLVELFTEQEITGEVES